MKQTFLALALAFATVTPLSAEPGQEGIRATITGQIDAFRAGDMARASDFASDGIRRIFGSSETFGGMVERGYAMVIAPVELRYGDLRDEAGGQVQRVLIRDAAGTPRYGISSISLVGQTTPETQHAIGRELARTGARLGHAIFPPHGAVPDTRPPR